MSSEGRRTSLPPWAGSSNGWKQCAGSPRAGCCCTTRTWLLGTSGLAGAWQVLANGLLGVDFFFVLSGFIIAHSSAQLVAKGKGWRQYASARAIRIYVPYLPIGVAMLVLFTLVPGLSAGTRGEVGILTSLTLLPSNAPPALSVAWTLVHEVLFYALFSVFFVSRLALGVLLATWVAAIAWTWAAGWVVPRAAAYLLSPVNLCFVLGVLLQWATRRGVSDRTGIVCAVLGALLIGAQAVAADPDRVLVALGFAGLVTATRSPVAMSAPPGRASMALGAASYAIYLVHGPATSVLARAVHGHPLVVLVAVAAGALAAGLAYHLLYEQRARRWIRTLRDRPRKGLPAA